METSQPQFSQGVGLSSEADSHFTCASDAKKCHAHVPMHVNSSETSWVSACQSYISLGLPVIWVCVAGLLLPALPENKIFQRPFLWLQPGSAPMQVSKFGTLCSSGSRMSRGHTPASWKVRIRHSWYSGDDIQSPPSSTKVYNGQF